MSVVSQFQRQGVTGQNCLVILRGVGQIVRRQRTQLRLQNSEGQRMKPRAVSRELKLIRGIAQKCVAKEIGGFGVHGLHEC